MENPALASGEPAAKLIQRSLSDVAFRRRVTSNVAHTLAQEGWAFSEAELAVLRSMERASGRAVLELGDDDLEALLKRQRQALTAEEEAAAFFFFEHRERVFDSAERFFAQLEVPQSLRAIYQRALREARMLGAMAPCLPAIDFPAAIHACLADTVESSIPLSVAGLIYYLGISLLDDVFDGELDEVWAAHSTSELTLAAIGMYAFLPGRALGYFYSSHVGDNKHHVLLALFQSAGFEAAIGEHLDLGSSFDDEVTPAACEQIAVQKTGSTGALMAALSTTLADAPPEIAESYTQICRSLYTSMQIASDIADIWGKPISPDLANGIVTLPSAYAYQALAGSQREDFRQRMRSGESTVEAHAQLRKIITEAGGLRYALFKAEAHRQAALLGLQQCQPNALGARLMAYLLSMARVSPWP
jgi:hypothetical protein